MLKYYIKELFNIMFLVTPLCSLVGISLAAHLYKISLANAILILIAMALANMAVDTLNDYADYKHGVDFDTVRTKFSGGPTGLLVAGKIKPKPTLAMALAVFVIALAIGIYFVIEVPVLIYFVIIGAATILLYSERFLYTPYMAELMLAVIYTLVPMGSFVALSKQLAHLPSLLLVSIPVGIVVSMVLLINEVPDREADKKHGRKSVAVIVYDTKKLGKIYLSLEIAALLMILFGIIAKVLSPIHIIVFLAVPLLAMAYSGFYSYSSPKQFEKYLAYDVAYFICFVSLLIVSNFL